MPNAKRMAIEIIIEAAMSAIAAKPRTKLFASAPIEFLRLALPEALNGDFYREFPCSDSKSLRYERFG
jgi:hypothetical protein